MTSIDITDVASTRTVNPLAVRDDYLLEIFTVTKFANVYGVMHLYKLYDSSRGIERESLENFTVLVKEVDACKMKVKSIVQLLMERLNYPEALSMEVSTTGGLDHVHFTYKDILEARNFLHKCLVAEVTPTEAKITPDLIVEFGEEKIIVPSRGVTMEAVKDELDKELSKFTGRPVTDGTKKVIESVVKSSINKHAFSYGKRV